jgi:uncharacterized protein (TIGR02996 family)
MPMSDAELMLRGILDQPDDTALRLVFADWLEEQGTAAHLVRAELLRLQCAWEVETGDHGRKQRALEKQARQLLTQITDPPYPLKRVLRGNCPLLGTGLALVAFVAADTVGPGGDGVQRGTVWKGTLHQGSFGFPTTWTIRDRQGNAFRGIMEEDFTRRLGTGQRGRFSFRGVVLCERYVAFVTGALSGLVSVPGLYTADLREDVLRGRWRVPRMVLSGQGAFRFKRSKPR